MISVCLRRAKNEYGTKKLKTGNKTITGVVHGTKRIARGVLNNVVLFPGWGMIAWII